jgi:hypothetical protein
VSRRHTVTQEATFSTQTIAHVIKNIMASATETELAALYINELKAVYIHIILEEIGHKQPPTPLQTDNAMADAVVNEKI